MAEEKRLIATIIPQIDTEALKNAVSQAFQQAFNVNVNVSGGVNAGGTGTGTGTGTGSNVSGGVVDANNGTVQNITNEKAFRDDANVSDDVKRGAEEISEAIKDELTAESEEERAEQQYFTRHLQIISGASSAFAGAGMSLMKNSFGILEEIYNRIKAASPLLQTIESLFNLAMTLFFMPLGNKLAEVLLPAVLELVDGVVEMWEAFDGMSLTEMVEYMMEYGVTLFASFFNEIGSILEDQGGLLGTIGSLLSWVGDFLENDAYNVLSGIFSVIQWVLENIKTVISLIVAFYAMQYASNIAMMMVMAIGDSAAGLFGAGLTVAFGAAAGLATYGGLTALGLAEGGYVPAREGGTPAIIGEGGEGEYVVPESKLESFGSTTINYYFTGYTDNDILDIVREEVSSQVSRARLKGGF